MTMGGSSEERALHVAEAQRRLSREELLRPRIHTKEVEIESLGGKVLLKSLSHGKRQEINARSRFGTEEFDAGTMTLLSILESVVEPKLTPEDIEQLAEQ